MEIKTGKWTLKQVLEYSDFLENEVNRINELSDLPNKPRYKEIEKFTMEVFAEWILK